MAVESEPDQGVGEVTGAHVVCRSFMEPPGEDANKDGEDISDYQIGGDRALFINAKLF